MKLLEAIETPYGWRFCAAFDDGSRLEREYGQVTGLTAASAEFARLCEHEERQRQPYQGAEIDLSKTALATMERAEAEAAESSGDRVAREIR